ncbi:DUF779 domain-containing protein [Phaeovulum vinaykumarii]|uniref:DUF779 domain-containing protein n=1 Tax=Phaeovulum vinaykumarii TaxID=407234 RepID=A0A1N7M2Y9_9RHOB|nr:DUF779 domain-containing protein [Phaeovulum vinaykumarii]SIS80447.1 hypothetical protein SAMN05421795_105119 [Phaeovulum vinaykumarii]SOC09208.1 hypothetical protein SAMN05878426_10583 [Phaeovulum vinaykumarii]
MTRPVPGPDPVTLDPLSPDPEVADPVASPSAAAPAQTQERAPAQAAAEGAAGLPQVAATAAARAFLDEIRADHGAVMFHVSGGCCDGSSPMCYPEGSFRLGVGDVRLGRIGATPVWMGRAQAETWGATLLTLDVVPGRGGMFSLDNGRERRFLIRSDLCGR